MVTRNVSARTADASFWWGATKDEGAQMAGGTATAAGPCGNHGGRTGPHGASMSPGNKDDDKVLDQQGLACRRRLGCGAHPRHLCVL